MNVAILIEPTITKLRDTARGAVVVCGSHAGCYPGFAAASGSVRAVILNDAGVGLQQAGIGSLPYLESLGIAAATVSHMTCRIGDAEDMMKRGVISHVNAIASQTGVREGMPCAEAAQLMKQAPHVVTNAPKIGEGRTEVVIPGAVRRIVLIDSAAMVARPDDDGQIIVTGSHGGLVGGNPAMALQVDGFAAIYNDAGGGIEDAGLTRLPALNQRGIAGITVSANSARIGEAQSIFNSGIISAVNATAAKLGAELGMPLRPLLEKWSLIR